MNLGDVKLPADHKAWPAIREQLARNEASVREVARLAAKVYAEEFANDTEINGSEAINELRELQRLGAAAVAYVDRNSVRYMECSCCGSEAGKWLQFHNRDTGYGICVRCVERIRERNKERPNDVEDIERNHGTEGIHWGAFPGLVQA